MRCYYEVLNVSRDADDKEIKNAYRKLALKWHPDRNLDNPDFAKEQFQGIQQAYEVLSDSFERTWYDDHREQILRGPKSEYQDKSLDIIPYFSTSCFEGYGDDENGFYSVYRKVFNEIANEDLEFMDSKEDFLEIPQFGDSTSDYDSIVEPFYSYWISYSTKKSFCWLDSHDISMFTSRREYKLMERDHKKARSQAKKKRNEEVRNLVSFIRKRDKRIIAQLKLNEARKEEIKKKQENIKLQKAMERKKLFESDAQAEWTKFDNLQEDLKEIEKHLDKEFGNSYGSEDNTSETDIFCAACDKPFKNMKSFLNHESSKKHKENVEALKLLLEQDIKEYNEKNVDSSSDLSGEDEDTDIKDVVAEENIDNFNSDNDSCTEKATKKVKKKNKKSKNILQIDEKNEPEHVFKIEESDDDFDFNTNKNSKKSKKKGKSKLVEVASTSTNSRSFETSDVPTTKNLKNNGKCKKKSRSEVCEDKDVDHCCVKCKSVFSSKNKLFEHLKTTGHSVFIPDDEKRSKNAKSK